MTTAFNTSGKEVWILVLYSTGWNSPYGTRPPGVETRAYPRLDLAMQAWKRESRYPQAKCLWHVALGGESATLLEAME